MESFSSALLTELMISRANHHIDNFDPMMQYDARYKKSSTDRKTIKLKMLDKIIPMGNELEIKRKLSNAIFPRKFYGSIVENFNNMSFLYNKLMNKSSKELLIKLLAYKILGYEKVKLPRNTPEYWDNINKIAKLSLNSGSLKINFVNLELLLIDLKSLGFNIKVNVTPAGAAAIFLQKQYEYARDGVIIKARPNDVVLDCGACWGETSLYFAHEVGAHGRVYSFEFIPENIKIFEHNLKHNPMLEEIIHLIPHPVWDRSDEALYYSDHGPGSSVNDVVGMQSAEQKCLTLSIDDFVMRYDVPRVDFIKMDIEGAEVKALQGAKNTIEKFHPTLAISLYHKPDDFVTIPKLIAELNPKYDFYLDHHTIHFWETVLYCVPRK